MEEIKELMCRLCLKSVKTQFLTNIVDTRNIYADKITALTGINIHEDIRYPQKMCAECRTNLEGFYNFRMKCLISQLRFKKEFIDKLKIVEGTPSIETVLIKEEVIDSTNFEIKNEKETIKDAKPLDETDAWSDDNYFTIDDPDDLETCIKSLVNHVDDEEEFFELITIIDDDKEEGVTPSNEDQDIVRNDETKENDFNEDAAFSSESEPDLFGFDEPEEVPVVQKRKYRERIPPNPGLKERREQDRLAAIAWKANNTVEKIQRRKKEKLVESKEVCHICGKFFNKKLIQYHLNWHNDVRPFACMVEGCDKTFYGPKQEQEHRRRHFEPKFICKDCGMKFYSGAYLSRHMLRHTKQWKFNCTFCAKKCANNYNLKVHMRIHTGERKFSCNLCKEMFAYNSLLKAHKVKCEKRFEEQDESDEDGEEEQSEE